MKYQDAPTIEIKIPENLIEKYESKPNNINSESYKSGELGPFSNAQRVGTQGSSDLDKRSEKFSRSPMSIKDHEYGTHSQFMLAPKQPHNNSRSKFKHVASPDQINLF